MTDQSTTKKVYGVAAIVGAAILAVTPFTAKQEGTLFHAYLDGGKTPTICTGHTKGVHMGDVATPKQCSQYLAEDQEPAMAYAYKVEPNLANNILALEASGDFVFNTGTKWFPNSPMRAQFKKGNWVAGCNAFVGYIETIKGVHSNGLHNRRVHEQQLCIGAWK